MRRGGFDRAARWPRLVLAAVLGVAAVPAPGNSAEGASLIAGNYQLDWSQDVDIKDAGTTDVRTLKQTLEVKYKGFVSPVVQNEVTFKVEQEIRSNAPDVTRFLPTVDLSFKGRFWEAKSGAKRTHENSNEPGKNPKITDSYVVELFYIPPKRIPDLKLKYTVDTDTEEGTTDTRKDGVTFSSVYSRFDWLDIKGDFTWTKNDDRLQPDVDTIEQKKRLMIGLRHIFSQKIKFDTQYTIEETRGGTLLDAGGWEVNKETQSHGLKNTLSFRPFRDTNLDGTYDVDVKQDIVTGAHNLTTTAKAAVTQKIGSPLNARLEFQRVITENKHTTDDFRAPEDTSTAELTGNFSKQLDFSLKYQSKNKDEVHSDPSKSKKDGTVVKTAVWTGQLAPFCKASASYDTTDTFANDVKTTVNSKYSLKATFDFKTINLMIEPTYDITLLEDVVKPEETETRDFRFRITYRILSTNNIEAKVDHTYGRKTDSLAGNIQRTDSSTGNVMWKDVLPGWTLGFDLTRNATDTSGDDNAPDIITTFGYKGDYRYEWLTISASYKYDKKSSSASSADSDTLDLKAGWVAPHWEASLTYQATKTYSVMLDEGYTITLLFKYIL